MRELEDRVRSELLAMTDEQLDALFHAHERAEKRQMLEDLYEGDMDVLAERIGVEYDAEEEIREGKEMHRQMVREYEHMAIGGIR